MRIKTNISYLFSLASLLLLAACEQDAAPLVLPTEDEPVEIRLTAKMANVDVSVTRALITDLVGTEIGLYGLRDEDGSMSGMNAYIDNAKLTATAADGGDIKLTSETRKVYFPTGDPAKGISAYLYAYAPYCDDNGEATITSDAKGNRLIPVEGGDEPSNDLLWANAKASTTDIPEEGITAKQVNFGFTHRMAKLVVKISSKEAGYQLTGIRFVFNNPQSGTMNLRDGSITATGSGEETVEKKFIGENSVTLPLTAANAPYTYERTALPLGDEENGVSLIAICVKQQTDTNPESVDEWYDAYDATVHDPIRLLQGKSTTVNISFNPSTDVSGDLNEWEDGEGNLDLSSTEKSH